MPSPSPSAPDNKLTPLSTCNELLHRGRENWYRNARTQLKLRSEETDKRNDKIADIEMSYRISDGANSVFVWLRFTVKAYWL